jgi:hypothetical protein
VSNPIDLAGHLAGQLGGDARRLSTAPRSFVTRRVPGDLLRCLCAGDLKPKPGDVVLARLERLGHHTRLHLPDGRRRQLFVGDAVVLAYANRYASSQYEAVVPEDLGPCHLAAGGGIAARVTERNHRIRRGATAIQPLGLVTTRAGEPPLNLASFARPRPPRPQPGALPVLAVVGSAMDSGKTTAAAHLARGLSQLGRRVGYAKVTGTVAAGDPWLVADAGAEIVLDMADAGYASTYGVPSEALDEILLSLLGCLQQEGGLDAAILEVADGLLQPETAALLASERFDSLVNGILFAARDSMSALLGVDRLRRDDHRLLGLTGTIEASPLERREAATAGLPFFRRRDLADPQTAAKLLATALAA